MSFSTLLTLPSTSLTLTSTPWISRPPSSRYRFSLLVRFGRRFWIWISFADCYAHALRVSSLTSSLWWSSFSFSLP
jgi:hypothetical protein